MSINRIEKAKRHASHPPQTQHFGLKEMIENLERRPCYFAKNGNFFTFKSQGLPPGHEYRVFFDVRKERSNTAEMVVQSAYVSIHDRPRTRRNSPVGFRIILLDVLLGRKPKRPP